jgi:23S rRNA (adenine2503-C2)-methyltransferase
MNDLYRLLPGEVDALMAELGEPRYRADQLLRALWHAFPASLDEITTLPAALRARLAAEGWGLGAASEVRRSASEDGNTTKLLLRMHDGTLIETVLMQYPEPGHHPRSTVCVSTQAGCAMGCVFCATGQMGFERNLRRGRWRPSPRRARLASAASTSVSSSCMGEPLANYGETVGPFVC